MFTEKETETEWTLAGNFYPENCITLFLQTSTIRIQKIGSLSGTYSVIFEGTTEEFIDKYDEIFERSSPLPPDMLRKAFVVVKNYLQSDDDISYEKPVEKPALDLKAIEAEHGKAVVSLTRVYVLLRDHPTNKNELFYGQEGFVSAVRYAYLEAKDTLMSLGVL